jgi:hypothetical protein
MRNASAKVRKMFCDCEHKNGYTDCRLWHLGSHAAAFLCVTQMREAWKWPKRGMQLTLECLLDNHVNASVCCCLEQIGLLQRDNRVTHLQQKTARVQENATTTKSASAPCVCDQTQLSATVRMRARARTHTHAHHTRTPHTHTHTRTHTHTHTHTHIRVCVRKCARVRGCIRWHGRAVSDTKASKRCARSKMRLTMNAAIVPSSERRSSFFTTRFSPAIARWYESTQYPNRLQVDQSNAIRHTCGETARVWRRSLGKDRVVQQ